MLYVCYYYYYRKRKLKSGIFAEGMSTWCLTGRPSLRRLAKQSAGSETVGGRADRLHNVGILEYEEEKWCGKCFLTN